MGGALLLTGCTTSKTGAEATDIASGPGWRTVDVTNTQKDVLGEACFGQASGSSTTLCQQLMIAILTPERNAEALSSVPLNIVERLAKDGFSVAQYELGKRFETGEGVQRDIDKAEQLYERAARDHKEERSFYTPGVGGAPGSTTTVPIDPVQKGLPEAKARLDSLRSAKQAR